MRGNVQSIQFSFTLLCLRMDVLDKETPKMLFPDSLVKYVFGKVRLCPQRLEFPVSSDGQRFPRSRRNPLSTL